jgi:hypothetical protein
MKKMTFDHGFPSFDVQKLPFSLSEIFVSPNMVMSATIKLVFR